MREYKHINGNKLGKSLQGIVNRDSKFLNAHLQTSPKGKKQRLLFEQENSITPLEFKFGGYTVYITQTVKCLHKIYYKFGMTVDNKTTDISFIKDLLLNY